MVCKAVCCASHATTDATTTASHQLQLDCVSSACGTLADRAGCNQGTDRQRQSIVWTCSRDRWHSPRKVLRIYTWQSCCLCSKMLHEPYGHACDSYASTTADTLGTVTADRQVLLLQPSCIQCRGDSMPLCCHCDHHPHTLRLMA